MARTDEQIKKDVIDQLVWDDRTDASKISVEVSNGTVTLRGEVPTYLSRSSAESDAVGVIGVTSVRNQLVVSYPPIKRFPTDADIEGTILKRLSADPDLDLLDLEAKVDAGFVTLKGTVDAFWKKYHAESLVESEAGVISIENHIAVVPSDDFLDKEIANDIVDSLERKTIVDAEEIHVRVKEGDVTLTGTIPSYAARQAVYESALYTSGVKSIEDRMTVSGRYM
jgi:osmotically-inducible protein OsmY